MHQGTVIAIVLGQRAEPLRRVEEATAIAGWGLDGDRYCRGAGSFSSLPGKGREVTLIEMEALESLPPECALEPAEARRNLVTRGVRLNDLVGGDFRVGEVVLRGVRLCDPCTHLEKLTKPGVLQALENRGGLRADIVSGGVVRVGDTVSRVEEQTELNAERI